MMSDERQLLDDYVLWSNTKELDTSIDAFLAERKATADALRIAEAIHQADIYESNWTGLGTINAIDAASALKHIQHILIDDRPTITDLSLTGERRTYLI